jgi:hypothetical protein
VAAEIALAFWWARKITSGRATLELAGEQPLPAAQQDV